MAEAKDIRPAPPANGRLSPRRLEEIRVRHMRTAPVYLIRECSPGDVAKDVGDLLDERETLLGIIGTMSAGAMLAAEEIARSWPDNGSCDGGSGECKCKACGIIARLWAVADLAGVERPPAKKLPYRSMTLDEWMEEHQRRIAAGKLPPMAGGLGEQLEGKFCRWCGCTGGHLEMVPRTDYPAEEWEHPGCRPGAPQKASEAHG